MSPEVQKGIKRVHMQFITEFPLRWEMCVMEGFLQKEILIHNKKKKIFCI